MYTGGLIMMLLVQAGAGMLIRPERNANLHVIFIFFTDIGHADVN